LQGTIRTPCTVLYIPSERTISRYWHSTVSTDIADSPN